MKVSEEEMLHQLVLLMKGRRGVGSPDYNATAFYTDQWKCYGSTYFYQLPRRGKVVAIRTFTRDSGYSFYFDTKGVELSLVPELTEDTKEVLTKYYSVR
jgi:hypothetical protein